MTGHQPRLFDVGTYKQRIATMERPGRWSMHATAARAALVYTIKPSFGSFIAYIEAIWSKDQLTNDTNTQIATALGVDERTVKRHLAQALQLHLIETRRVRINGRQRRVLAPGKRLLECAEIAPPERRTRGTGSVTPRGQDRSPEGDRIGHPKGTGSVTHQKGVEPEKGREPAPPPGAHPLGTCKTCGHPTEIGPRGTHWETCWPCKTGQPRAAEEDDSTLLQRIYGPAIQ